jgi:hypothetical protein
MVSLILSSPLIVNVTLGEASPSILSLKWVKNVVKTHLAPLAADIVGGDNGIMEIVATGMDSQGTGCVVALNSTSGDVIWRYNDSDPNDQLTIGTHSPFDIVDLNKDGIKEIVVSAYVTFALFGNNGTVYWLNTNAFSYENYNAIQDIDGDGYPEIFICSGTSPWSGSDRITSLSYDGSIQLQAWAWHCCFGGITIGDANSDGRFEIYVTDRSVTYSAEGDSYFGGGMGIRALDAQTLQPLWNNPAIKCSSNNAMLADVNKDGVLDLVVAEQGNRGVAVFNATDGSVMRSGGIYRWNTTGTRAHSQPTICDIDGDGNLEFISSGTSSGFSSVRIWDLFNWSLDAGDGLNGLDVSTHEPPKAGDLTGDGRLDLVAANDTEILTYSYNSGDGQYFLVDRTGLWGFQSNDFTLIQDVENDGFNELVVSSLSGYISFFDTPGLAPTPRVRSDVQFYSERRLGATEFLPQHIPDKPVVREEEPRDQSINTTFNPVLSLVAVNFQQHLMNVTFSVYASGSWQEIQRYSAVGNGEYAATTNLLNKAGRTYLWSVTATDLVSLTSTTKTYSFATHSNAPTQGNPFLTVAGGTLFAGNQSTADVDGDTVTNIYNWYLNNQSFANLNLPFDSQKTSDPLSSELLFSEGFETSFASWNSDGVTDWSRASSQRHAGLCSALADASSNNLTSNDIDTSSSQGIRVSFWYRDFGVDKWDVFLQFWNGLAYVDVFDLGDTKPERTWQFYQFQTFDRSFLRPDFRIRFNPKQLGDAGSSESLWIDDVSVATTSRTVDYSGYDNHATIHGATWTSDGVVGGAFAFDGENDYLQIPDDSTLDGNGSWSAMSVEFWIKPASANNGAIIIAKKAPTETLGNFIVSFGAAGHANTLVWGVNRASGWQEISSTIALTVGNWYHVVCTYDGSWAGLRIYINGIKRGESGSITGNIARAPSWNASVHGAPVFIGYDGGADYSNSQRRWLNGSLDEIRVYPKGLVPEQSRQRYLETLNGLSNSSTIVQQEASIGETWVCKVTPNDGLGDGGTRQSNNIVIGDSPVQHNLHVEVRGSGVTNATGNAPYAAGTNVLVKATASSGCPFIYWLLNDTNVGSANLYALTMNSNYNLTAVFAEPIAVQVVSPENRKYTSRDVLLAFTLNKPASWIGYSINGERNVTIAGNDTIVGLANGLHNVTVYARDAFENVGISETIIFTVNTAIIPEFPSWVIMCAFMIATLLPVLVYFKKRKLQTQTPARQH